MDITRKFLQMGYTRSTRYALRPGGRKYSSSTGIEIPRTGEIADQEKYNGSLLFKQRWKDVEEDEVYSRLRGEWEVEVEGKKKVGVRRVIKVERTDHGGEDKRGESPLRSIKAEPTEEEEVKVKPEPTEQETITSTPVSVDRKPPPKTSTKSERKTRSHKTTVKEEQEDRVKSESPEP
jgi:hypothetical protein